MPRYKVFTQLDASNAIPRSGRQRQKILAFLASLQEFPLASVDYINQDASSSDQHVKYIDDYSITYWIDEAIKAVMVVDIQRRNKREAS